MIGPNNAGKTNLCSALRFLGLTAPGTLENAAKEVEIACLVECAPLKRWLASKSFEDFYAKLWHMSKQFSTCRMETHH
ncbi:MAG: hypothetical protein FJ398_12570 [Verrucomicrobia bacterium]|nr:hypothetical protein [Verrucomicrobiota bacterium]